MLAEIMNSPNEEDDSEHTARKKMVFLDIMLTSSIDGVTMNDDEINDEVSTFVFAVNIH